MTEIKKSKVKWTITVISFIMTLVMFGTFMIGIFNRPTDSTESVGRFDWSLGTVDSSGRLLESRKNILMTDMQKANGLKVTIDENATVTYKVVYYDENKAFVSITEALYSELDASTIPETATYFRVIVTPLQVDGEDVTISRLGIYNYAKQLTVIYAE